MVHGSRIALLGSALAALTLMLAGCGRLAGDPATGVQTAAPETIGSASTGPPFPDDRLASGLTESILLGKDAAQRSGGTAELGTALLLNAAASNTAEYAVYRFNPGGNPPDSVSVLLDAQTTSGAFIGLANYATHHWEFSGPYTATKTLAIDGGSYQSPLGNLWFAIMVPAGKQAIVNALSVRSISPANLPPVASLTADVTSGDAPLTVNFDASASSDPDGTIIEYAWDWEGDGLWDGFSDGPVVNHVYAEPGVFNLRMRVTDEQFARSSPASVQLYVYQPPVAVLTTDTPLVNAGETVTLDASGSYDSDGVIVYHEWDLDGNGIFTEPGPEAQSENSTTASVRMGDSPGPNTVAVRVTDDSARQDTAELAVAVRGWMIRVVDSADNVGEFPSLKVVNGRPAISYLDIGNTDLKYAHSSTADGSSGWTALTVDAPGNVGLASSLSVINGKPAISYFNATTDDLKYAYSTTAYGDAGWTALTVEAPSHVGGWSALAAIAGRPAISYWYWDGAGPPTFNLKYAYSSSANGSSGWSTTTVDPISRVGAFNSLAVINGKPAVSYHDSTNLNLKYAYSSAADGSFGWTTLTVDSLGEVGRHTSLAAVNGKPAISYYDGTNGDLKYAYSSTADGSSGWTAITVDAPGDVGTWASLAVVWGRPAIGYCDVTNQDLKYAFSSTADGSSGWSVMTVDSAGDLAYSLSLAVVKQNAAISYFDGTNHDLKYAMLFE